MTYDEVISVPLPQKTRSYTPVSNEDIISLVKDQIEIFIPEYEIIKESYYLSKDQQRLITRFDLMHPELKAQMPLCVLVKNSYDKTTSTAIGTGISWDDTVLLRAEDIYLFRKHTKNVFTGLSANIAESLDSAVRRYTELIQLVTILKEVPCSETQAFALFGIARGYGAIGTRAMSDAYKKWAIKSGESNLWDVVVNMLGYIEERGEPRDMMEDAGKVGSLVQVLPDIFNLPTPEVAYEFT